MVPAAAEIFRGLCHALLPLQVFWKTAADTIHAKVRAHLYTSVKSWPTLHRLAGLHRVYAKEFLNIAPGRAVRLFFRYEALVCTPLRSHLELLY
jgi:hypothetical protein